MRISLLLCMLVSFSFCTQNRDPVYSKLDPVLDPEAYNVGFLIMDGVYNTELTAPFDIFQHTRYRKNIKPMNVFTISEKRKTIRSFEGIQLIPDYTFTDKHPSIDILVIPSAEHHLDSDLENETMLQWVRKVDKTALYMTSHCDGAFVLAKAGLLTQHESTTFPGDIDLYQEMFPKLRVVQDVVFVHDGKYITSAGGARSFDAALYLCELLYGKEIADQLAGGLVIEWDLESIEYKKIDH